MSPNSLPFWTTSQRHSRAYGAVGYTKWVGAGRWRAYWPNKHGIPVMTDFGGTQQECHNYVIARRLMEGLTENGMRMGVSDD